MAYCSADRRLTYLDTPSFYSTTLHCLSIVSILTHTLGAYCILFQTPPRMASIKWSLLTLLCWTFLLDLGLNFLTIPYLVIPMFAGYPLGFLRFTGMPTKIQTYIVVSMFAVTLVSVVGIFENRYHVMTSANHWWRRARIPWAMVNYLIAVTFFYPVYYNLPEDQTAAKVFLLEMLPCLPEDVKVADILVIAESPVLFVNIGLAEVAFLGLQIAFFYRKINGYFQRYGVKLSKETLTMHRKLMQALILQLVLPFFIVVFPLLYCTAAVWIGYHNQTLNNISFIVISTHGFLSTVAMIYMHLPYRQVIIEVFKPRL